MKRIALLCLASTVFSGAPSRSSWPAPDAEVSAKPPAFASDFGVRRIFLDAGHGSDNNPGNRSAYCLEEQAFTLDLAKDVARVLADGGHFEVKVSRVKGELVAYPERVRAAEAWRADAFVSLHSDVRGQAKPWVPDHDRVCFRSHDAPGFSILWSDSGDDSLVARRHVLAGALATELVEAGFLAFDGKGYQPAYEPARDRAGSFVDRHAESERIFVLWRPSMPSLIVETHNALDDREARRWNEDATRSAFAQALARALATALTVE